MGAAPPFFVWMTSRTSAVITTAYPAPYPYTAGLPLASLTRFSYLPLTILSYVPGVTPLIALPCLYTTARAPRRARAWVRAALRVGLVAALAGPVIATGYFISLRVIVGHAIDARGAPFYLMTTGTWIMVATCGVAAIMAARGAGRPRLITGLLAALVGTALGSPLLTAGLLVGACGERAWRCAESHGGQVPGFFYGNVGTSAPVDAAVIVVLVLIWGRTRAMPAASAEPGATAPASAVELRAAAKWRFTAVMIVTAYLGMGAATCCCAHYVLGI
jgi:hypothetical protein